MSFRNRIARIFGWWKKPSAGHVLESQSNFADLDDIIKSFTNDAITLREKIFVVHKNIVYEKDKQLNKIKEELEKKQGTILGLQKLIEKQQEIIKELRELVTGRYVPDKQQEETIEKLKNTVEKQQVVIKELQEQGYVPNKQQEEIIGKLKKEIEKYQVMIKAYEESTNKLNAELDEIRIMYQKVNVKYQEVANKLEKERETASSLERESRKEQGINNEFRKDFEKKTSLISEYEKSARTLKGRLDEISNRYQEATEKYEKEKQNAVRLEMLILDLDKELGLMDAVKKIEEEEKLPEITIDN